MTNECEFRISGLNQDGTYIEMSCGDFGYLCEKCQLNSKRKTKDGI